MTIRCHLVLESVQALQGLFEDYSNDVLLTLQSRHQWSYQAKEYSQRSHAPIAPDHFYHLALASSITSDGSMPIKRRPISANLIV